MSFPHEVIAAWPTPGTGDPDRELIRAMTTRRFAYCLADDELASDFVAKDPVSGIPPLYLAQNGTLYAYDETDSTTAPSAVCLVTNDACRYKSGVVEPPYSVLTYSTTAQPADVSVSDGDTFLLPIGATGADWAGKAGQIAMRVGAKWHFAINPIGRRLYVEDEDRFYYRNDSGVWTAGNGSLAYAANSIPITAVIGAKASFQIKVENQTTNAPPASPVAPVAYIIGPSPTGAWAGKAGQLAVCLVNGAYTYIVPDEGDEVWDKNVNNKYTFNGTAWISSAGVVVARKSAAAKTFALTTLQGAAAAYVYSDTTAPKTTDVGRLVAPSITYAAKKAGAVLRISYQIIIRTWTQAPSGGNYVTAPQPPALGLLRDSEADAIAWRYILPSSPTDCVGWFEINAPDTSSHIYKFKIFDQWFNDSASNDTATYASSVGDVEIEIQEFA